MEGDIAATYALVYRFLRQQSQHKAAEAVKKAARPFVVLRDDIEQKGPPLEEIIKAWKARANTNLGNADASSEDAESDESSSDSESSSGSDSSSEESKDTSGHGSEDDDTSDSDGAREGSILKKSPQKPVERDTSVTLSSAGEPVQEVAGRIANVSKESTEGVNKIRKNKIQSDSSDSDSSSQSSASDSSDAESSSSDSGSSSSSDSSDEDGEGAGVQPPKDGTKTTATRQSTSESSSESEDEADLKREQKEDIHVAKKRKTSESEVVATAAVVVASQHVAGASQKKEKPPPKVKERFQRVKIQRIAPESLLNNGYEERGGAANDYGERAHRDLISTRGVGFRKEKNKKKRGSYRGGEITMENHSIRFDF